MLQHLLTKTVMINTVICPSQLVNHKRHLRIRAKAHKPLHAIICLTAILGRSNTSSVLMHHITTFPVVNGDASTAAGE